MAKDGSLAVEDITALKGWRFEEIDDIIKYDNKNRYEMWETNEGVYRVRALCGWSVAIGGRIDPQRHKTTRGRLHIGNIELGCRIEVRGALERS